MRMILMASLSMALASPLAAVAEPFPVDAEELAKAKAVVLPADLPAAIRVRLAKVLKDPMSAQVTVERGPRVTVFPINEKVGIYGKAVCAAINARNSYGAYSGARTYVFLFQPGGGIGSWPVDDGGIFAEVISQECRKPADQVSSSKPSGNAI